MPQQFGFGSLLTGLQIPIKRKIFVSYHHGGDKQYYDSFMRTFSDTYDIIFDNSVEREVDSDDVNYVIQRIRDNYIRGSSCTIVLCGAQTPWRKYVDWEIKATLDMEHGLIGLNLPTNRVSINGKYTVPARLHDNITSDYAVWTPWSDAVQNGNSLKRIIEDAIARNKALIVNNRPMMSRNGNPPW